MPWTRKDLLAMRDLDPAEITLLIDTAASLQEIATREIKKVPALRGKTIVNLFYEPSTRTRTSFEIAHGQEILPRPRHGQFSSGSWMTTRSSPSCSRIRTATLSRRDVGRFLPT